MPSETAANRLQARFLHPIYRRLDGVLWIRWIYTPEEMAARGDPRGDPVASWVNWFIEHGLIVTVGWFGGRGAAAGALVAAASALLGPGWSWLPVLVGAALGATVGAVWYWRRERRNRTLGTWDGRMDAIAPTLYALALWAAVGWALWSAA